MINQSNNRLQEIHSYLQNFRVAQMNLNKLIQEERLKRKLVRSGSRMRNMG